MSSRAMPDIYASFEIFSRTYALRSLPDFSRFAQPLQTPSSRDCLLTTIHVVGYAARAFCATKERQSRAPPPLGVCFMSPLPPHEVAARCRCPNSAAVVYESLRAFSA